MLLMAQAAENMCVPPWCSAAFDGPVNACGERRGGCNFLIALAIAFEELQVNHLFACMVGMCACICLVPMCCHTE